MAGHEPPTGSEAVKAVLRGIRRTIGSAKQGKAPATADLIGQMVALCLDSMIGRRDRALLCLGFAGAFRRSELCALEVADLTEVPDGLRIRIRVPTTPDTAEASDNQSLAVRSSPLTTVPPQRPKPPAQARPTGWRGPAPPRPN
jgi:integrase